MKNIFKQKRGITLIALVITIIVLLILAGISISMLSGDNSILQKSTEAKESTEAATIKEQAEIIRNGMLIDKTANNLILTQGDLVAGIATDSSFAGSTTSGNKVVTKDSRYDINVASDLTITVTPHTYGGDEQETISFYIDTYIEPFTAIKGQTWLQWAQDTKDDERFFVHCEYIYNSLQNFIINNSNNGMYNNELYSTDGAYELWFIGPDGTVKPLDEICDGR